MFCAVTCWLSLISDQNTTHDYEKERKCVTVELAGADCYTLRTVNFKMKSLPLCAMTSYWNWIKWIITAKKQNSSQ